MKQRNLRQKVGSLLLATAMIVTLFPVLNHEVHAAELPDSTKFATVDQLKSFNTNDTDGDTKAAKVYFGNNNQKWWIAGSQDGNLTLFAESPIDKGVAFEPNFVLGDASTHNKKLEQQLSANQNKV